MTNLKALLKKLGACQEAVSWAYGMELAEAWEKCERADWMLWLCGRMEGKEGWPNRKQIVLVACKIAEDVLPIYEKKYPDDKRVRQCIETVVKWCNGEATIKEVLNARAAAASAYTAYAYYAYYASAAYAAYAATAAATAATSAASASAASASAVRQQKLKQYADLIRQELKIPVEVEKP
jgi:hypothetical protein